VDDDGEAVDEQGEALGPAGWAADLEPEEEADLELEELEEEEDELEEEDLEDEDEDTEEVPTFLGRNGKLYLFHSPDKLVEFVQSGAEHDLSHLDTWADLVDRVTVDDIEARAEDCYELDLVVENLRGGPDAWDPTLILKAGEVARDLAYALRLETVLNALAAGSPLDDLDDALRATDAGGVGGFFAKRKMRKIPAQQTSLAWRTVIGKISAAADWRD
jgi:hypothetical protein